MKKLSLLLLAVLILLACFTGCQDTEDPHTHLFENATVIKSPCIVAGEEVATCACGETRSTAILPTGKHIYENGVCIGCNQNEIPLYDVTSAYDADGDGQEEVYYFSPVLSNRFDDAVHLSAGDYDRSLSSSSVGNSSYNAIGHWYVAYRSEQSIVYRVTVAESGRYEMALHLYIDDMDAHGAQYTVNSGSDKAENFETSFRFNKTDYREARNAATCGTYMYGITVNLVAGENTITVTQSSETSGCQFFRDLYFDRVGDYHRHAWENETVTEATCGKDGVKTAVCSCGLQQNAILSATGAHNYVDSVCSVCDHVNATHGIVGYEFLYDDPGFAGGTVQFKPEKTGIYSFYWGDENGKLADYTMVYSGTYTADKLSNVTIQSFTAIPQGATRLLAINSTETVVYSYTIPKKRLMTATELYAFGSLSDTHNGTRYGSTAIPYTHFVNAAEILYQKGAIAIGISGDISYKNIESEYKLHAHAVKLLYNSAPDMPIFTTTGNHEIEGVSVLDKDNYIKYTRNLVEYKSDLKIILKDGNDLDYVVELPDGSVMIYFHQIYYDYGKSTSRLVTDEQLDWLGARFEEYKDRTVFFYFHTFMDGAPGDATSLGGYEYTGSLLKTTEDYRRLDAYFQKYTNVIYFSGHSHFPFDAQFVTPMAGRTNDDKNIDDRDGYYATLVHIPSCAAPRVITSSGSSFTHAPERSEGFLIHVYEDYIVFEGYDFINEQTFAYATYIIHR